jgi:malate dehydrogenase (oxaloacetate-decarboxylating)
MLDYIIEQDPKSGKKYIKTSLSGKILLNTPQLNKDTAFTQEERLSLGLLGKIPDSIEILDEQVRRTYFQLQNHDTRLRKFIFLNDILDKNHVLFYRLVELHIEELLPIIYTPTVGTAVKTFSQKFRRSRGLYISYENRDHIEEILNNRSNPQVDIIVVTDGEGVLGIGDQGIGAMDIPIAKLAVYTLLAGINPNQTLPIMLDVGTDNEALLNNPMYLGWRHKRLRGKAYDDFIDIFVQAVKKQFPHVFLHWEDFGRENAYKILMHYQHELCTFNDDMQGTGIVALSAVLAAVYAKKEKLIDQRIVIFGAGTAGMGIAEKIYGAMVDEGISEEEAKKRFWLIDRYGLITTASAELTPAQEKFKRDRNELKNWNGSELAEVVKYAKPTVLIGCSSVSGAFTQAIIEEMLQHVEKPLIMPLSNPNQNAEATPQDIVKWTKGKAFIATGSPFDECEYEDQKVSVSQCNNALIFPGLGLGIVAIQAKRLTARMINAAAKILSTYSPMIQTGEGLLLPKISEAKNFSANIALAVAKAAVEEKMCEPYSEEALREKIQHTQWQAQYLPIYYQPSIIPK